MKRKESRERGRFESEAPSDNGVDNEQTTYSSLHRSTEDKRYKVIPRRCIEVMVNISRSRAVEILNIVDEI